MRSDRIGFDDFHIGAGHNYRWRLDHNDVDDRPHIDHAYHR